jgi:hypothetical protein
MEINGEHHARTELHKNKLVVDGYVAAVLKRISVHKALELKLKILT